MLREHQFKSVKTNNFQLSSGCDTVAISFEARLIHGQLPSELTFAQSVLKTMRLSSLVYGVVCINKRLTYITNDVLTSRHECRFYVFASDLDKPRRLANCKLYTRFCSRHPPKDLFRTKILFCSKSSHNMSWYPRCQYKLCVKTGPASLKSLCVNNLGSLLSSCDI